MGEAARASLALAALTFGLGCTPNRSGDTPRAANAPSGSGALSASPAAGNGPAASAGVQGGTARPDLVLHRWVDDPVRAYPMVAGMLVSDGESLGMRDAGEIYQDGLLTRVPGCEQPGSDIGKVLGLAGSWPKSLFMLRATGDPKLATSRTYRWAGGRWQRVHDGRGPTHPWLTEWRGQVLLIEGPSGEGGCGYTVRALPGLAPLRQRTRRPDGAAGFGVPVGAAGGAQGPLVVWGSACHAPADAVVEVWKPDLERIAAAFPAATVTAAAVDAAGSAWVALRREAQGKAQSTVQRFADSESEPMASVEGHIVSLAPEAAERAYAVLDPGAGRERTLLRLSRGASEEIALSPAVGRPERVVFHEGVLWVEASGGLFASERPEHEWVWARSGCGVATVSGAKPYLLRHRRPPGWTCAGDAFLLVERTRGLRSEAFRRLDPMRLMWVGGGPDQARRIRKGEGDPDFDGGLHDVMPVVARELDAYYFGVRIRGPNDFTEYRLNALHQLTEPAEYPVLCARPLDFPIERVRELAAPAVPAPATSTRPAAPAAPRRP